jgi:hypothetical protein
MSVHHMAITVCLLALPVPAAAFGQTPAADSARDSASAGDSASVTDSASSADSIRSTSDSAAPGAAERPAGGQGARSDRDSTRAPEARDSTRPDSILSAACSDSGVPSSTARDLLVVVFAPKTGRADQVSVAASVKGRLLGPVTSEPGAFYLWVPTAGQESRLRAAADRLIRSDVIRQVGSRTCPATPPADTNRSDSATQQPRVP